MVFLTLEAKRCRDIRMYVNYAGLPFSFVMLGGIIYAMKSISFIEIYKTNDWLF